MTGALHRAIEEILECNVGRSEDSLRQHVKRLETLLRGNQTVALCRPDTGQLALLRGALSYRPVYYRHGHDQFAFSTDPSRLFAGRQPSLGDIEVTELAPLILRRAPDLERLYREPISVLQPATCLLISPQQRA